MTKKSGFDNSVRSGDRLPLDEIRMVVGQLEAIQTKLDQSGHLMASIYVNDAIEKLRAEAASVNHFPGE